MSKKRTQFVTIERRALENMRDVITHDRWPPLYRYGLRVGFIAGAGLAAWVALVVWALS